MRPDKAFTALPQREAKMVGVVGAFDLIIDTAPYVHDLIKGAGHASVILSAISPRGQDFLRKFALFGSRCHQLSREA